ncbi:MAG: hypothetical protein MUO68_00480, partial [Desulfobacteraceae bacterium]|nr:hypothetical protein [Desulfobacteraceae bacterium]
MEKGEKRDGWEVARELEANKTLFERFIPEWKQIKGALVGIVALFLVFLLGCWLAGNPFDATQRIPSEIVKANGWVGTNQWAIIWSVVLVAMFFEFMDASAGMGFGTALTPLLLVMGFDP